MKTIIKSLKIFLIATLAIFLLSGSQSVNAELKPRERNILANEAKTIDLSKAMIIDNSWNKLPGYKARQFWESLPANIRQSILKELKVISIITGLLLKQPIILNLYAPAIVVGVYIQPVVMLSFHL